MVPRFHLPTFGQGRHRLILACLACGLLSALLGFILNLPMQPLADSMVQKAARAGLDLVVSGPSLGFPLGLQATRVELALPELERPPLELREVSLSPVWMSLIGSNPGVRLNAEVMSGHLQAEAHRTGDLDIRLSGLQLSENLGPRLPLQLVAQIDSGSFTGRLPLKGNNPSQLQLEVASTALVGLKTFGAAKDRLNLGRILLKAEGRGNRFQIHQLAASGGELTASGSGTLTLGPTPARSRLILNLQLRAAAGLDAGLRDLLPIIGKPGKNGSRRLQLSGPLTAIQAR